MIRLKYKIIVLVLIFDFLSFSQVIDKRYTHNSENGYMWLDFDKRMIAKNIKYDFLSSMLENQSIIKLSGSRKDDLGCDNEVNDLKTKVGDTIELNEIVKMIDKFYSKEVNLIIPIRYAYCYCIKELAGLQSKELKSYGQKLLKFSNSDLK